MLDLIQQSWRARSVVQAWRTLAGGQINRTILPAPKLVATAVVVADVIGTLAMNARLEFDALVNFNVTNRSLVADVTFTGVRVYLKNELPTD